MTSTAAVPPATAGHQVRQRRAVPTTTSTTRAVPTAFTSHDTATSRSQSGQAWVDSPYDTRLR